jgi:hypothetical protein
MHPAKISYDNKPRLNREITEACKDALDQVSRLLGALPDAYRDEVILDYPARDIRNHSLLSLRTKKAYPLANRAATTYNPDDFNLYSQMLAESIDGIKQMMPAQFGALLTQQVAPFLKTLESISLFAKANNLQTRVPLFDIPEGLKEQVQS